jgi:UDP-N-acetylglucosamine 2-epimerase (non-hydrolysing)
MTHKLLLVAGARPNFMKIAPLLRAAERHKNSLHSIVVHTGQHYDTEMSESFFASLGIREPDYNLGVGSGTHAVQTANIMIRFEDVCAREKPDMVVVVGDVNSTIAAGLVAKKLHIPLGHVEAGLRSRDRTMPEEINRIATDAISDLLFTTEKEGTENLLAEGHAPESVHFVGHVMIDNLLYQMNKFDGRAPSPVSSALKSKLPAKYACLTLHRPSNVDHKATLANLVNTLADIAEHTPIVFPCHPRTRKQIESFGLGGMFTNVNRGDTLRSGIIITEPLGYADVLPLWRDATLVLTDSGGLQEETTALQVPCITMRATTERPITVEMGSNVVVGDDTEKIRSYAMQALRGKWKMSSVPPLWDGRASERIVSIISHYLSSQQQPLAPRAAVRRH